MTRKLGSLTIIIPVYNEAPALLKFYSTLDAVLKTLDTKTRILFVNDGSTDSTEDVLNNLEQCDSRVFHLSLSRNFGHQAALTAGLDHALPAQAVLTMDGDGQHPPDLIPEMVRQYEEGFDVVLTRHANAERVGLFKRMTAALFYRAMKRLTPLPVEPSSSDFRLLSSDVWKVLTGMRERHRFLRGMVIWAGFPRTVVDFMPRNRISGVSKYSFGKMAALAAHGVFSFSTLPLKLCSWLGLCFLFLALCEAIWVLMSLALYGRGVFTAGWPSLIFFLLLLGGVQLVTIGILGVYVGYIFEEVKRRPLYVVSRPVPKEGELTADQAPESRHSGS